MSSPTLTPAQIYAQKMYVKEKEVRERHERVAEDLPKLVLKYKKMVMKARADIKSLEGQGHSARPTKIRLWHLERMLFDLENIMLGPNKGK